MTFLTKCYQFLQLVMCLDYNNNFTWNICFTSKQSKQCNPPVETFGVPIESKVFSVILWSLDDFSNNLTMFIYFHKKVPISWTCSTKTVLFWQCFRICTTFLHKYCDSYIIIYQKSTTHTLQKIGRKKKRRLRLLELSYIHMHKNQSIWMF